VGKGSPEAARWGGRQGPRVGGSCRQEDVDGRGGICWFVRFSPLSLPPFQKVGSRFGSARVFGLVSRGPFGPLAPVVPVLGIHGQPLYFPVLPRPWSSPFWAPLTSMERMWIDLGQVGFRIRHGWVFLSCPVGSFGPLAPVVPRWGITGGRCVFHGLSLFLRLVFPVNLDSVLVLSACGWRVWQVAPVFPLCGGPLALFRVQLPCPIFFRSRGSIR
jgi:hypothetical protein